MKKLILILTFLLLQCNNLELIHPDYRGDVAFLAKKVNIVGDSISALNNGFDLQKRLGPLYLVTDYSVANSTYREWIFAINGQMEVEADIVIVELGTNDALQYGTDDFEAVVNTFLYALHSSTHADIVLTAMPLTNNPSIQQAIQANNDYYNFLSPFYRIADMESAFANGSYYSPLDELHPLPEGISVMGNVYADLLK